MGRGVGEEKLSERQEKGLLGYRVMDVMTVIETHMSVVEAAVSVGAKVEHCEVCVVGVANAVATAGTTSLAELMQMKIANTDLPLVWTVLGATVVICFVVPALIRGVVTVGTDEHSEVSEWVGVLPVALIFLVLAGVLLFVADSAANSFITSFFNQLSGAISGSGSGINTSISAAGK